MTCGNANVAGRNHHVGGSNCNVSSNNANVVRDIRYVGGSNCNVSINNANVAGDIRYLADRIANAGDRIDNVPVQRLLVTFNATSSFRPLAALCSCAAQLQS